MTKKFYKMTQSEQEKYAIDQMQKHYAIADEWKRLSVLAKKRPILEKEIERPDEAILKDESK